MPRAAHLTTVHNVQDPRIFWKECRTLEETGYEVHLVAQHRRDEVIEGVQIQALPPVDGRYRRLPLLWQAYRRARALQADLYHFHDPELIPVAYALQRATGAAVVYDMHENYRSKGAVEGRLLRALERWCFRWVDHVLLAEKSYASLLPPRVPSTLVENYAQALPPGEPAEPIARGGAPCRLLYTGVVADERGLATMMTLAERLAADERDWRMDIVGVCYLEKDRSRAERRLRETPALQSVLHLRGWEHYVPLAEMRTYYQHAHVGLALMKPHQNYLNTLPTKFYEYLQAGLPILCSDFPLWRRFIEENACGAVVPAGDVEAAFRMLEHWAAHPAEYERLAANARTAAPRYRWERMGERLLGVYRELLG